VTADSVVAVTGGSPRHSALQASLTVLTLPFMIVVSFVSHRWQPPDYNIPVLRSSGASG